MIAWVTCAIRDCGDLGSEGLSISHTLRKTAYNALPPGLTPKQISLNEFNLILEQTEVQE